MVEKVEVGKRYLATISGQRTVVRIDREHRDEGFYLRSGQRLRNARTYWTGTNLLTNRTVMIRSRAKLSEYKEYKRYQEVKG